MMMMTLTTPATMRVIMIAFSFAHRGQIAAQIRNERYERPLPLTKARLPQSDSSTRFRPPPPGWLNIPGGRWSSSFAHRWSRRSATRSPTSGRGSRRSWQAPRYSSRSANPSVNPPNACAWRPCRHDTVWSFLLQYNEPRPVICQPARWQMSQAHCLNHLYTVKPRPPGAMRLITRGHQFELPAVKYEFNKLNFLYFVVHMCECHMY